MSDVQVRYLETFAAWIQTLGLDAEQLAGVLAQAQTGRAAREAAAGALNYLFKSLDLVPDGIDDIGYLDDAFVLRVAARMAEVAEGEALPESVARLSAEAGEVEAFLDDCYPRLARYVEGLRGGTARGRTVSEILDDPTTLRDFLSDVAGFKGSYDAPGFGRDVKNLIKLRGFLEAKLPK